MSSGGTKLPLPPPTAEKHCLKYVVLVRAVTVKTFNATPNLQRDTAPPKRGPSFTEQDKDARPPDVLCIHSRWVCLRESQPHAVTVQMGPWVVPLEIRNSTSRCYDAVADLPSTVLLMAQACLLTAIW